MARGDLIPEPASRSLRIFAFDPSLWWNNGEIVRTAAAKLGDRPRTLYLAASSDDVDGLTERLAGVLRANAPKTVKWHYEPMPNEKHATIYHPAALQAFRQVFKP